MAGDDTVLSVGGECVQNSNTNLDPANALAKVEIGTLFVTGAAISNAPSITLTDDIVYYGG